MEINSFIIVFCNKFFSDVTRYLCSDELAFLAIEEKIEKNLRDKLAWLLQEEINKEYGNGKYLVKVEWSPSGRKKCDIAVLKLSEDTNNIDSVVAMIEMKDHSTQMKELDYSNKIKEDIDKIKKFREKDIAKQSDLILIFISHIHLSKVEKYLPAYTYRNYINRLNIVDLETEIKNVNDYHKTVIDDAMVSHNLPHCSVDNYNFHSCCLGSYFDHKIHLASSIYVNGK